MLTGQIKSPDDIPEGDMRREMPRFSPENFHLNMELVKRLQDVARKSGCTSGQLALAWVRQAGKNVKGHPQVIALPGATTTERVNENTKIVKLDEATLTEIEKILNEVKVVGTRYALHHLIEG